MPASSTARRRAAGYLRDVAGFDPTFFGIAPREAVFMDPQHRLLLEVAWEALENAGIAARHARAARRPACSSACATTTTRSSRRTPSGADGYAGIGGAPSIAAGRIAYLLGLHGPGHGASTPPARRRWSPCIWRCRPCARGECDVALAGGVNLILGPGTTTASRRPQMLAPDGRCKTFDAAADGFVRGEGCGVVVLKRLADAEADGDRVLAVIRGTRREPGRPQRRPHRAQRPRAGGGDPRGARRRRPRSRRGRLRRGARHRHLARRPDRGACAGRRVRAARPASRCGSAR